ncbi:MAG: AbrB/MazE/SpoVT family DNA-binding domain-containing protein [Nitrososphaerota archaeon]|nr:AbrB/MazE/SpoVT family DNA-binding domain-containing protein [Nitrososphaerota archaeon]
MVGLPRFHERRVQQLRGSSFVITLPKEWVEESGLKKGSAATVISERDLLRVVPSGRRLTVQLTIDADLLGDLVEDVMVACYEAGVSSLRVLTRRGRADELLVRTRRLRERLQGMFTTMESEGSVAVEISGDPFRSVEQALSVTLQSLVRALRRVESDLSTGGGVSHELEELLKDCAGHASSLKRMVSQMVALPDEQSPFYAIPALMEAASNLVYLVRDVEESVASIGRQELMSLIHLAEVLEQLNTLVVELRNSVVIDQLHDLAQSLREAGRRGGQKSLLRGAEDFIKSLIRLNALMTSSESRTSLGPYGPT